MFTKKVQRKVIPRKVGMGLNERRWCWRLAWWESDKEVPHLLRLRGKHQYSDQCSSQIRAPCVTSTAAGIEGKKEQMARSSIEREQLTEESRKIIDEKKEKVQSQEQILAERPTNFKRVTFVSLKNHAGLPI